MKSKFDRSTLKVMFKQGGVSRNITDVVEVKLQDGLMSIRAYDGKEVLINFNNVNMVEEIERPEQRIYGTAPKAPVPPPRVNNGKAVSPSTMPAPPPPPPQPRK